MNDLRAYIEPEQPEFHRPDAPGSQDPRIKARPILKWAGGKWQALRQMEPYLPRRSTIQRYFEPFLGGGAAFFYLQPTRAFLSDTNPDLILTYKVVKWQLPALISFLSNHLNERDYYLQVRKMPPEDLTPVERASRLIFLNKTCYNGLYRVNSNGRFNVPFGRYPDPKICDAENLSSASALLRGAAIRCLDFEEALSRARQGDFVYLDPPYHPLSPTSSFTSYTSDGFGEEQQRRLAAAMRDLKKRHVRAMLSNSDAPLILELYPEPDFTVIPIRVGRAINSNPDRRGKIGELLILNY